MKKNYTEVDKMIFKTFEDREHKAESEYVVIKVIIPKRELRKIVRDALEAS